MRDVHRLLVSSLFCRIRTRFEVAGLDVLLRNARELIQRLVKLLAKSDQSLAEILRLLTITVCRTGIP